MKTPRWHQLQGARVPGRGGKLVALSSSRGDRRAKQSLKCSQLGGLAFTNAAAAPSKPTGRAWLLSGRLVIICAQQSGTRVSPKNHDLKIPSDKSISLNYLLPSCRPGFPDTQTEGSPIAGVLAGTFMGAFTMS